MRITTIEDLEVALANINETLPNNIENLKHNFTLVLTRKEHDKIVDRFIFEHAYPIGNAREGIKRSDIQTLNTSHGSVDVIIEDDIEEIKREICKYVIKGESIPIELQYKYDTLIKNK